MMNWNTGNWGIEQPDQGYQGLGIGGGWPAPWVQYKGQKRYLSGRLRGWPEIFLQSPTGMAVAGMLGLPAGGTMPRYERTPSGAYRLVSGGPDPYTAALLRTLQNVNQAAEQRQQRLQRGEELLGGATSLAQQEYQRSLQEGQRGIDVPDIVSKQFNRVNEALAQSAERAMGAARAQASRLGYSPSSPMTTQMQENIRRAVLGQQQQALSTAALNQAVMEQQARERALGREVEARQRALLATQGAARSEAAYLMEEPSVVKDPLSQLVSAEQMWETIVRGRPQILFRPSSEAGGGPINEMQDRLHRLLLRRALGSLGNLDLLGL